MIGCFVPKLVMSLVSVAVKAIAVLLGHLHVAEKQNSNIDLYTRICQQCNKVFKLDLYLRVGVQALSFFTVFFNVKKKKKTEY